ncbi:MAG: protein kinase [Alphaproteobacteria bacterium]|nr:protein kinase [Alphaproteobacteria bacterium]
MGEVWAATHVSQGRPVALKLLTDRAALDPKYRRAFRNEIRNAAQLDHPNVVAVYDYGEVTEAEAEGSAGKLARRTPWLAMELVEGGTLLPHCGTFDWMRLMDVVLGLLDSLAHAHARGVYHRDLKPANVLLGRRVRAGVPLVVKLSDFGLAHAADGTEDDHFNGGTPSYMAPEQFDGRWRNYGPWTDLYGLGCLLYALIRGRPPFGPSTSFAESRRAHHEDTVPALDPPFAVPAGFESWIRRLLEKDPARRYRRAADALYDFLQLGPPERGSRSAKPAIHAKADLDTLQLHTLSTLMDLPILETEEVGFTVGSNISKAPPLPHDWRDLDERRADRVVRTGLRMFGLRPVPFVGREKERDALWAMLGEVRDENAVRVAALHGPSGFGKSRLADWLCQRAHEVGSAIVMKATHGPVPGPRDGLAGLAHRFLRCEGLGRAQLAERVRALTSGTDEREALLELLAPGAGSVRFGSAEERHWAVRQLLLRATSERPAVVWLDDVHWGPDTLRFVRRLLADDLGRPVLVVMTATDEALAERTDEHAVWEELLDDERVYPMLVGSLPPEKRSMLVEEVLGLDATLGEAVEEGTRGNPLFAVQLIGDWVERDLLEPGPSGFVPREGVTLTVPDDIGSVWERRVDRLLKNRRDTDARALELAAVLGMTVNRSEWTQACQLLGVHASQGLVEALLHTGLATSGDGGYAWVFAHRKLPEALVRRARRAGHLDACHAACAGLLLERLEQLPSTPVGMSERLGRHLLGAGEAEAALEPLMKGIVERVNAGDYAIAEQLIELRAEALEGCGVTHSDVRWGLNQIPHFHIARRQGRMADATSWLDGIEAASDKYGWDAVMVECRVHRARMYRLAGEWQRADRTLRRALENAVAIREPRLVAEARFELGELWAYRGQLDRARSFAQAARADYERLDDTVGQARCWQALGEMKKEAGEYRAARELLRRAEQLFEVAGNRWGRASAINSEGDAARHEGNLDEAEQLYRRSGGLFRAIGSGSAIYPEYNFALTLIARGQVTEARPIVERALKHFREVNDGVGLMNAHFALAACEGDAGRWGAWDAQVREGREMVVQLRAADEDTAWVAEVCGQRAQLAGMLSRARSAYELALETWKLLERDRRVANLEAVLSTLAGAT